MTTLKHLAHGVVVYLASVLTTALSTKVTIDKTFLISLVPGVVAAVISALSENQTAASVLADVKAILPLVQSIEKRLPASIQTDVTRFTRFTSGGGAGGGMVTVTPVAPATKKAAAKKTAPKDAGVTIVELAAAVVIVVGVVWLIAYFAHH